ncbi:MAG: hypothetical protein CM15mP109_13980 [Candidatus Dadabacteria bacterium]|nr:MAG: hypothetical protein CM15mP109_13980 [Candidatus Dadabacteria bacterium]
MGDLEGMNFYIIGGFESGMDAAFNLSSLGKKVNVWIDNHHGMIVIPTQLNLSPIT